MDEVVIVEAVRTPMGRRNGRLKDIHPVVLASLVMKELLARAGLEPVAVDDVVWGCVTQVGEQGVNVGRNAWLTAGFPVTTPATTVDRQCGSSQQAIHFAANLIASGVCSITIAGGVESMSRIPIGVNAISPGTPFPPELLELYGLVPQGISAELMARKYGISRRAMDEFSVRSHRLAAAASEGGHLSSQIMPIEVTTEGMSGIMDHDEGIRPHSTYEAVAALSPAFNPEHTITAGNSSQITDGSAAVLLMSRDKATELGLRPRARIVAQAVVGTDPVLMLEGPIPATAAVLRQAGLTLSAIDLFEVNEAFASVVLAWLKETGADPDKTNVNGGAIAIGHPLGASGARLMNHLLYELERRNARYGLQAMCCGGGLGIATIIEKLD
ncbi:MAG TPA: thiolase family protein [Candidatus Dormibacteraeota bacterium]|jgi:acetyl-CoA acetyltransferase family protein|nr:thiolase family protein [Candidatus Dormibacteraeota bacterium]